MASAFNSCRVWQRLWVSYVLQKNVDTKQEEVQIEYFWDPDALGGISPYFLCTCELPNSNVFQSFRLLCVSELSDTYQSKGFECPPCICCSNPSSLPHVSLSFNHPNQNWTKSNGVSQDADTYHKYQNAVWERGSRAAIEEESMQTQFW